MQALDGLRVAGVVLVGGLWEEAGSQAACWVWHRRVFSGCMLYVCWCGGMYCRGGEDGSPVLFGRAGQLFGGEGGQVAVCVPELSEGGVGGDWGV